MSKRSNVIPEPMVSLEDPDPIEYLIDVTRINRTAEWG